MDPFDHVVADAELLNESFGFTALAIAPKQVTPADISQIESKLPLYDHVAFAFLAYDDPSRALDRINDALNLKTNKQPWQSSIISPWFDTEGQRSSKSLIEILWLLQNWELLRSLGIERNAVRMEKLESYRHTLFHVIEKLDDEKLTNLVNAVEGEMFDVEYAEVVFLTWLRAGKINLQESSTLIRAVRDIGLEEEARKLEILEAKRPTLLTTQERHHSLVMTPLVSLNEPNFQVQSYVMSPQTAGLCLIFNQRNFWDRSSHLRNRLGTEVDCQRLQWTFRMFGYDVVVFNNRTAREMVTDISTISQWDFSKHNSLVLCILSHGVEGAVYGSDGEKVKVRDLALSFAGDRCPSLNKKPKLIFVQACQGIENQAPVRVNPYQDITTDGPESSPTVCDFFEAWATVPGFVSYRSESRGSIFVSALCDVLQHVGHEQHLEDVMKLVHTKVSGQDHKTSAESSIHKQMPVYTSCLTKNLRFTRHKEWFIDSLVERLEEHFLNLLIRYHVYNDVRYKTSSWMLAVENVQ